MTGDDQVTGKRRELFYRVADHIETHPELYDQFMWRIASACGTAHCVAGTAVALEWGESAWRYYHTESLVVDPATGHPMAVSSAAQRLLGLTDDETSVLFCQHWGPREGLTVPQALRLIGDGEPVEEVTADD